MAPFIQELNLIEARIPSLQTPAQDHGHPLFGVLGYVEGLQAARESLQRAIAAIRALGTIPGESPAPDKVVTLKRGLR
jgi:hypothetical protein